MKLSTLIVIYTIWIHRTKINTRIIEPRNTYPPLFIPFFNSKKKKKKKKKSDLVVEPPRSTRSRLPEEIYTDTRYKYALDANTMAGRVGY